MWYASLLKTYVWLLIVFPTCFQTWYLFAVRFLFYSAPCCCPRRELKPLGLQFLTIAMVAVLSSCWVYIPHRAYWILMMSIRTDCYKEKRRWFDSSPSYNFNRILYRNMLASGHSRNWLQYSKSILRSNFVITLKVPLISFPILFLLNPLFLNLRHVVILQNPVKNSKKCRSSSSCRNPQRTANLLITHFIAHVGPDEVVYNAIIIIHER